MVFTALFESGVHVNPISGWHATFAVLSSTASVVATISMLSQSPPSSVIYALNSPAAILSINTAFTAEGLSMAVSQTMSAPTQSPTIKVASPKSKIKIKTKTKITKEIIKYDTCYDSKF